MTNSNLSTRLVAGFVGLVISCASGDGTAQGPVPGGALKLFAGNMGGSGSADGKGDAARFNLPAAIAVDGEGNLYVGDVNNRALRKILPDGTARTLLGGAAAPLRGPYGVAVDGAGNVYVLERDSYDILRITPDGAVSVFAGAAFESRHVDGTGAAARFLNPVALTADRAGNLYVAEVNTVRKITPHGVVTTLAGRSGVADDSVDAKGSAARFGSLAGIAVDAAGNIFVADSRNRTIRKITPDAEVSTFSGKPGERGRVMGHAAEARFESPIAIAVDGAGNVYVSEGSSIRRITLDGNVSMFAGRWEASGSADGAGAAARFQSVAALAADREGNVYASDSSAHTIRKITPAGVVSTVAGMASATGAADGSGAAAGFYVPDGLAIDRAGNVYVADKGNDSIRKVTRSGVVTTLAGPGVRLSTFAGIVADRVGNVYVGDPDTHTVLQITPAGEVITLAGTRFLSGHADGKGRAVLFNRPSGIARDIAGNLYVLDTGNAAVRKITPAGEVNTFAREVGEAGIAVDRAGNVYVSAAGGHALRKIAPDGTVSDLAGKAGEGGSVDAIGAEARFGTITGIAVHSGAGNVYVADGGNRTIRKIAPDAAVSTLAGKAGERGSVDATGAEARFNSLSGILVARSENLYVSGDAAVRKITPGGTVTTFAGKAGERGIRDGDTSIARFLNPGSLALDGRGNIYVHDRSQNNLRMIGSSATSILVTYENGRPKSTYLGEVITLAGRLTPGDGLAATRFDTGGSAVDVAGNRYLLDKRSKTLRKTTLAGESITYTRAAMRLGGPEAVAVDGKGNVYVADTSKHVIRQITPDAEVVRLAGMDEMHGGADGTGLAARFNSPSGIAVDSAGNLFVADSQNHAIRKIAPGGVVTTFAGRVGVVGSSDGSGAAARFANPRGIAIDGSGNLYVADTYNNSLRKITPEGIVSTLVGKLPGFTRPQSIAIDEQGNLYVAHTDDHIVRRITPDGVMSTVAGVFGQSGFTPGALPGLLGSPRGVAVAGRSLYITLYNGVAVVDLP